MAARRGEHGVISARGRSSMLVLGVVAAAVLAACSAAEADRAVAPQPRSVMVSAATSTPAKALAWLEPSQRTRRLSVVVGGDLLIHEAVWESARSYAGGDGFDFDPMFEPVADVIDGADLGICHLEVPLSADNTGLASYPRFNAPHQLADAIATAGFDGCSFASNHTLDQGVDGIDASLGHLDRVGVGHAGAARTPEEATTIRTYEVRGHRVAHLSYSYGFNGLRRPAGEEWRANLIDPARIGDDAARARAEGADLVLVSLHWGDEYVHAPNQYQRDVAATVAGTGDVDLIIGHHAHVIQPVEVVEDTWVAYGVGNLLSNMTQPARRDGVLLEVHFEAGPQESFEVAEVGFLPTQVERAGHRIVPAPADSWERTASHLQRGGAPMAVVHRD